MIIITAVYVVATIIICIFNIKSATAVTKQVAEQIKEFKEIYRPCIDITIERIKSGLIVLKIENTGKKYAKKVNLKVDRTFVDLIEEDIKLQFSKAINKERNLGINQYFFIYVSSHLNLEKFRDISLKINVCYDDSNNISYEDNFEFDLTSFVGILNYSSPTEDIAYYQKEISKNCKSFLSEFKKLSDNCYKNKL